MDSVVEVLKELFFDFVSEKFADLDVVSDDEWEEFGGLFAEEVVAAVFDSDLKETLDDLEGLDSSWFFMEGDSQGIVEDGNGMSNHEWWALIPYKDLEDLSLYFRK